MHGFRGLAKENPVRSSPSLLRLERLPIEDRHRVIDNGVLVVTLLVMVTGLGIHPVDEDGTGNEFHWEGIAAAEIRGELFVQRGKIAFPQFVGEEDAACFDRLMAERKKLSAGYVEFLDFKVTGPVINGDTAIFHNEVLQLAELSPAFDNKMKPY